uniref:Uncharacterized protein n=1 Tax=Anguilla anguilla TaxID=7936 RepID=A0A0E9RPF6_ANGAN
MESGKLSIFFSVYLQIASGYLNSA